MSWTYTLRGNRDVVPRRSLLVVGVAAALAAAAASAALAPAVARPVLYGAAGAGAVVLAVRRLRDFVMFFIVFLFFEGILKNVFDNTAIFFARDALLAVIYVAWLFKFPLRRGVRGRYDGVILAAVAAFIAWVLFLFLFPFSGEAIFYRLGGARWWLANVPLFFVGADVIDTPRRFDRLSVVYLAAAAVVGGYGVFQYFFGFDHLLRLSRHYQDLIVWSYWYGFDAPPELRRRVFATFDLPPSFAAAMNIACLIAAAYAARVKNDAKRILLLLAAGLFFAALAFSGTRAAFVPLVVAVGAFFILSRFKRHFLIVVGALGLAVIVVVAVSHRVYWTRFSTIFTDYTYTLTRVSTDWEKAVELTQRRPLGLGISTAAKVGRVFDERGLGPTFKFIENGYGQALVSLGWPGLALFIVMLLAVPARLLAVALKAGRGEWRAALAFGFCFSQLFPMFTSVSLYSGLWPVMYWLWAGAGTAFVLRASGVPARCIWTSGSDGC